MFKEILICIVIVVSIFALDMVSQKYTEKKANELKEGLSKLKYELMENKLKNEILKEMDRTDEIWKNMHIKMAYYIEHDELEKIETDLTNIRSYIEMEDKKMAISLIDKCSFIMEHITEKNTFNLENIF